MAQNAAQQKLKIQKKISVIKKALQELSGAVSALDQGLLAGIVPDSYSQAKPYITNVDNFQFHYKGTHDAILALPIRTIFRPIIYGAAALEDEVVDLLFDLFPAELIRDNIDGLTRRKR
jgi:hypothetical protein